MGKIHRGKATKPRREKLGEGVTGKAHHQKLGNSMRKKNGGKSQKKPKRHRPMRKEVGAKQNRITKKCRKEKK